MRMLAARCRSAEARSWRPLRVFLEALFLEMGGSSANAGKWSPIDGMFPVSAERCVSAETSGLVQGNIHVISTDVRCRGVSQSITVQSNGKASEGTCGF